MVYIPDKYNYVVFRGIPESEREAYKKNKDSDYFNYHVEYFENEPYLCIYNFPSFEEAETAIKSYWRALDILIERFDYK